VIHVFRRAQRAGGERGRTYAFLLACALLACSRAEEPAPETPLGEVGAGEVLMQLAFVVQGEPTGLEIRSGVLAYCEARGGRTIDLRNGRRQSPERACPDPTPPNPSCAGLERELHVRPAGAAGVDMVEFGGRAFNVGGRVQDCAVDGDTIAVVTDRSVVAIDAAGARTLSVRTDSGGQRVALGSGWIAWSNGSELNGEPLR